VRVVAIDFRPCRGIEPALIQFLRTLADACLFFVAGQCRQRLSIEDELVVVRDVAPPAAPAKIALRVGYRDQL